MENSKESILEVLRNYTVEDFTNWIDDILTHGVAYPIYTLSSDGDIIVELPHWLKREKIATTNFELAVLEHLKKYDVTKMTNDGQRNFERLLSSLETSDELPQLLRGYLIDLLVSKKTDHVVLLRSSDLTLTGELLQIMDNTKYELVEVKEIRAYISENFEKRLDDILFWRGVIRFERNQQPHNLDAQFKFFEKVFDYLITSPDQLLRQGPTFLDQINELYWGFEMKSDFTNYFKNWKQKKLTENPNCESLIVTLESGYMKDIVV